MVTPLSTFSNPENHKISDVIENDADRTYMTTELLRLYNAMTRNYVAPKSLIRFPELTSNRCHGPLLQAKAKLKADYEKNASNDVSQRATGGRDGSDADTDAVDNLGFRLEHLSASRWPQYTPPAGRSRSRLCSGSSDGVNNAYHYPPYDVSNGSDSPSHGNFFSTSYNSNSTMKQIYHGDNPSTWLRPEWAHTRAADDHQEWRRRRGGAPGSHLGHVRLGSCSSTTEEGSFSWRSRTASGSDKFTPTYKRSMTYNRSGGGPVGRSGRKSGGSSTPPSDYDPLKLPSCHDFNDGDFTSDASKKNIPVDIVGFESSHHCNLQAPVNDFCVSNPTTELHVTQPMNVGGSSSPCNGHDHVQPTFSHSWGEKVAMEILDGDCIPRNRDLQFLSFGDELNLHLPDRNNPWLNQGHLSQESSANLYDHNAKLSSDDSYRVHHPFGTALPNATYSCENLTCHRPFNGVPVSMHEPQRWYYEDPQGRTQGEFTDSQMYDWLLAGRYFTPELRIRRKCDDTFSTLADYTRYFERIPFIPGVRVPSVSGGITPAMLNLANPTSLHRQLSQANPLQMLLPDSPTSCLGQMPSSFAALNINNTVTRQEEASRSEFAGTPTRPLDNILLAATAYLNNPSNCVAWLKRAMEENPVWNTFPSLGNGQPPSTNSNDQSLTSGGFGWLDTPANGLAPVTSTAVVPPEAFAVTSMDKRQQDAYAISSAVVTNTSYRTNQSGQLVQTNSSRQPPDAMEVSTEDTSKELRQKSKNKLSKKAEAIGSSSCGVIKSHQKSKSEVSQKSVDLVNGIAEVPLTTLPKSVQASVWAHSSDVLVATNRSLTSVPPVNGIHAQLGRSLVDIQSEQESEQLQDHVKKQVCNTVTASLGSWANKPKSKPTKTKMTTPAAGTQQTSGVTPNKGNGHLDCASGEPTPRQQKSKSRASPQSRKGGSSSAESSCGSQEVNQQKDKSFPQQDELANLIAWCKGALLGMELREKVDIPTFVELLATIDAPYEVEVMLISYFGDTSRTRQFVKDFLDHRRCYWQKHRKQLEESLLKDKREVPSSSSKKKKRANAVTAERTKLEVSHTKSSMDVDTTDPTAESPWVQIKSKNNGNRRTKKAKART